MHHAHCSCDCIVTPQNVWLSPAHGPNSLVSEADWVADTDLVSLLVCEVLVSVCVSDGDDESLRDGDNDEDSRCVSEDVFDSVCVKDKDVDWCGVCDDDLDSGCDAEWLEEVVSDVFWVSVTDCVA